MKHTHPSVGFFMHCPACADDYARARDYQLLAQQAPPQNVCVGCQSSPAVLRSIEDPTRRLCLECSLQVPR